MSNSHPDWVPETTASGLVLNDCLYWYDRFDYMGSHQATVPLVLSGLLTQTVQLQLVDLQVRPDNKNPIPVTSSFSDSKAAVSFSDSSTWQPSTGINANRAWNVFTHCKPLRKAAYTSSSRSGCGVLVGGSLVEPVNILLPYKARFSWIKQCWGRERNMGSFLIRPLWLFQLKHIKMGKTGWTERETGRGLLTCWVERDCHCCSMLGELSVALWL